MDLQPGTPIQDIKIDRIFVGACTNARLEDLRAAAEVVQGRKVHPDVYAMVVPGSAKIKREAEEEGLDRIFTEAGLDWRVAGCSMCLGMNPRHPVARPALRRHLQPQLRGAPGQGRAHPLGQPGHGRRRRHSRPLRGRARALGPTQLRPQPSGIREGQMTQPNTTATVEAPVPTQEGVFLPNPLLLDFSAIEMTDEQFVKFCADNGELRIELTAEKGTDCNAARISNHRHEK